MPKPWNQERPKHGITLLSGDLLLCSCGEEIRLGMVDQKFSQAIKNDLLLDRHKLHRIRQEKK